MDQVVQAKAGRVIVFTRYPEAGSTKTRLIPLVGEAGAALLQQSLTERAIAEAAEFCRTHDWSLEVRFSGGNSSRMAALFGGDFAYQPQGAGDLGAKLTEATGIAFDEGASRVIVIGADCPDVSHAILQQAASRLERTEVVIGPASDGGYYLIGMSSPLPGLFSGIDWGTDRVCQQTLDATERLRVRVSKLQVLSDVDHPEDVVICRRLEIGIDKVLPRARSGLMSIVIPTYNEADNIRKLLPLLVGDSRMEVLVTDGGSQDETREIAAELGARVIVSRPGRGTQMNTAAAIAQGEYLLFLHADTKLPAGYFDVALKALDTGAIAGAFRLRIGSQKWAFRLLEWAVWMRSRWLQLPYGDQALFIRADTFFELGGFRCWPLMEDFEFARRLARRGRMLVVPEAVITSARRWERLGILRAIVRNQCCVVAYFCGVSPQKLASWYRRGPRRS